MPGNHAVDMLFQALNEKRAESDIDDLEKKINTSSIKESFIEMDSQELSILCRNILDKSIPYHIQKNLEEKIKRLKVDVLYEKEAYDKASWWSKTFGRFGNNNPYDKWSFNNEKLLAEQLFLRAKFHDICNLSLVERIANARNLANRLLSAAKYAPKVMVSSSEIHELNCWKIDDEVQTYRK